MITKPSMAGLHGKPSTMSSHASTRYTVHRLLPQSSRSQEGAGDTIKLTNGGRQFLIDYKKLVDYVAVSGWVRFTEAFTSAPRLHDKIGGTNLKKGPVWQWRHALA